VSRPGVCSKLGLAALLTLAGATDGFAQRSVQVPLEFNFINPGAKSMALAGAFAGVADDATASFANPAGLTFLQAPEISLEVRGGRTLSPYLRGGRTSGTPTNQGIDTFAGPVFEDSSDSGAGISYASFVYPHPSHRWVVAGYRHELLRSDQYLLYDGAFGQASPESTSQRDFPLDGTRNISITGYGASGAYKLTQNIAIGGALVVYQFDMDAEFKRYFTDDFFAAPDRDVTIDELRNYGTQSGSGVSIAPVAGMTFDRGSNRVGAVYRHGASFDFDYDAFAFPPITAVFRVPHTFSVGASRRVSPQWLVAAEVTHLWYSRLNEEFITSQTLGDDSGLRLPTVLTVTTFCLQGLGVRTESDWIEHVESQLQLPARRINLRPRGTAKRRARITSTTTPSEA